MLPLYAPYDFVTDGCYVGIISDGITDNGADYEDEDAIPDDNYSGHGTHVAGIIGAQVDDEGMVGAAYGANILPIKVFIVTMIIHWEGFNWSWSNMIYCGWYKLCGFNNADIINMSLGGILSLMMI